MLATDASVQDLIDAAPDALVVVDVEGAIAMLNRGAERLLGYECQELLGQPFVVLVATDTRDATLKLLLEACRPARIEQSNPMVEVVARRKDGTDIPVEVSLNTVHTGGRKLIVAAVRDISARKRLEQERLELLIREQAARLKAEAAVQQRDELLATVTHDLRQPLTIIYARAELISDLVSEITDDEAAQVIRTSATRIAETSTTMTAALQELIDLARMQMGKSLCLERTPVDLAELARRVADEQRMLNRASISINTRPPVVGLWDENRLERVLRNLLENALKYSPDGGDITITVRPEGQSAVLELSDNGIGIPQADLERIFDWSRRGSNVTGVAPGTGLGLAGARRIVEQHGGYITVSSQEGLGSTFIVRLPIDNWENELHDE